MNDARVRQGLEDIRTRLTRVAEELQSFMRDVKSDPGYVQPADVENITICAFNMQQHLRQFNHWLNDIAQVLLSRTHEHIDAAVDKAVTKGEIIEFPTEDKS